MGTRTRFVEGLLQAHASPALPPGEWVSITKEKKALQCKRGPINPDAKTRQVQYKNVCWVAAGPCTALDRTIWPGGGSDLHSEIGGGGATIKNHVGCGRDSAGCLLGCPRRGIYRQCAVGVLHFCRSSIIVVKSQRAGSFRVCLLLYGTMRAFVESYSTRNHCPRTGLQMPMVELYPKPVA